MGANPEAFPAYYVDRRNFYDLSRNLLATVVPDGSALGFPPYCGGLLLEEELMSEIRRRYDPEFKSGAVRIVLETRKPIARVARELGLHAGTLGNWVKQQRVSQEGNGPLGEDSLAELVRLRKRGGGVADGGVMCSNDLWSCGSRRRPDERGIAYRRPEDQPWRSPRGFLSAAGGERVLVLQVAATAVRPPPNNAGRSWISRCGRCLRPRTERMVLLGSALSWGPMASECQKRPWPGLCAPKGW